MASTSFYRGGWRHASRLFSRRGLLWQCCAVGADAGPIRHKHSDAPLCLYPSGDRHPDSMDWLECRHPANARARRALRFIPPCFCDPVGGQQILESNGPLASAKSVVADCPRNKSEIKGNTTPAGSTDESLKTPRFSP